MRETGDASFLRCHGTAGDIAFFAGQGTNKGGNLVSSGHCNENIFPFTELKILHLCGKATLAFPQ